MRVPIVVPDLGSHDEPLRMSGWFVDQGDLILAGDLVAEVLIPGITFDIVAETSGRLVEIAKPFDASIQTGESIGWIEDSCVDANGSPSRAVSES